MIKAFQRFSEYYIDVAEVYNEKNSYSELEQAKTKRDKDLIQMILNGDPKARSFLEETEKRLNALMPEDEPDSDHPLNDWVEEECGGGCDDDTGKFVHYLWINLYTKYDNNATWEKIAKALSLDANIIIRKIG